MVITKRVRREPPVADETGAVAVEFALVLVPLMLIVFGIISFGTVFSQMQALSNAARDAARAGVVTYSNGISYGDQTGCNALVAMAKAEAPTIGLDADALTVTVVRGETTVCSTTAPSTTRPCVDASETGTNSKLTVTLDYVGEVDLFLTTTSINLSGTGTFRCEYTS